VTSRPEPARSRRQLLPERSTWTRRDRDGRRPRSSEELDDRQGDQQQHGKEDEDLVERIYTDDVAGWSPTATATSRDDAVAEWRIAATHTGAIELNDEVRLEPTGRRVELRGVLIAEFDGDRIKRFRQYWDEVALLDGLGLMPED
jgi:hypothetical protein